MSASMIACGTCERRMPMRGSAGWKAWNFTGYGLWKMAQKCSTVEPKQMTWMHSGLSFCEQKFDLRVQRALEVSRSSGLHA